MIWNSSSKKLFKLGLFIPLCFTLSCSSVDIDNSKKPKNIILMIGDGMGPGQVSLLYHFLKYANNPQEKNTLYAFDRMSKNSPIAISSPEPY